MKSLSELVIDDPEFELGTLTEATVGDGHVELRWNAMGFGYDRKLAPDFIPAAGMETVMWGSLGRPVRGIAIDGRVIYYRTQAEEDERHRQWVEDKHREDREKYERDKPENDRRLAVMPQEFQDRIAQFRSYKPDWGAEFEGYELFVCEQAIAFAAELKTPENIKAFHAAPYERQRKEVTAMSDGHSGNTFGSACSLASLYLTNPELIPQMHGALCAMVGCDDYGCYAARKELTTSNPDVR